MPTLSLPSLGLLGEECNIYLAEHLLDVALKNSAKLEWMKRACRDMKWNAKRLKHLIDAAWISGESYRGHLVQEPEKWFLSSGEWMCGIFASGNTLPCGHIRMLMSLINTRVATATAIQTYYYSGKACWGD